MKTFESKKNSFNFNQVFISCYTQKNLLKKASKAKEVFDIYCFELNLPLVNEPHFEMNFPVGSLLVLMRMPRGQMSHQKQPNSTVVSSKSQVAWKENTLWLPDVPAHVLQPFDAYENSKTSFFIFLNTLQN